MSCPHDDGGFSGTGLISSRAMQHKVIAVVIILVAIALIIMMIALILTKH